MLRKLQYIICILTILAVMPCGIVHAEESDKEYYGRSALSELERGELLVQAYDSAVAQADSFSGGNNFSATYNLAEGQKLTRKESESIVKAVENDHPEYIWWSSCTMSAGEEGFTVEFTGDNTYYTVTTLRKRKAKFELAADRMMKKAGINDAMTELDKAYTLYQVIIAEVDYNIEHLDQSAYAAFVDKEAVCAGYAKAYTYLLQKSGLQASYVPGEATDGRETEGHAWVIVRIDGKYYYCDPTLDDEGRVPGYGYFMKTDAEMSVDHFIDDIGYSFPETPQTALSRPQLRNKITSVSVTGGNIYPENLYVRRGCTVAVSMVPNDGYDSDTLKVGEENVNPVDQSDGSSLYTISSVNGDISLSGTFREDTAIATQLVADNDNYTVMQGNQIVLTAALTTPEGTAVSGKTISFSSSTSFSKTTVTDTDGLASVSIDTTNLEAGNYVVEISFEGEGVYKASSAETTLNVVEKKDINKIVLGDLQVWATFGGLLENNTDYIYSDATGRLYIKSGRQITVTCKDGTGIAKGFIEISPDVERTTLTLDNISVRNNSSSSRVVGIDAKDTSLTLNIIGDNLIEIPDVEDSGSVTFNYGINAKALVVNSLDKEDALSIVVGNAGQESIGIIAGSLRVNNGKIIAQTGAVSGWSVSRTYGLKIEETLRMDGGSIEAVSGNFGYENAVNGTCGIYAGAILLNKGSISGKGGTATYGFSSGVNVVSGNIDVKGGCLKGIGGESLQSDEQTSSVGSYGIISGGDLNISNGEIIAQGSTGYLSCGLAASSSVNISGGRIDCNSGEVKGNESLACLVQDDYTQTGGTINLMSGVAAKGESTCIKQVNENGKFKINKGNLNAEAISGTSKAFKGIFISGGFATISGGSIIVKPCKAIDNSIGIYSVNTLTIEDGEIETAGDSVESSYGDKSFSAGILAGYNLTIKGGTIKATGKKANFSFGMYTYDCLSISGGRISASGNRRGLDGNRSEITGGTFAAGDIEAGKVCGFPVASGYCVRRGEDTEYPYIVIKSDGIPTGIPAPTTNPTEPSPAPTASAQTAPSPLPTATPSSGDENQSSKNPELPKIGTVENSKDGTGKYIVTGVTVNNKGKAVAEVSYSAPIGKTAKATAVTVPDSIILEDGSTAIVTEIAAKAFYKKDITSVVIGKNVRKIGSKAFFGCKKLKKIEIKTKKLTAKRVGSKAFKNINRNAKVYRPKSMKKKQLKNLKAALKHGNLPQTVKLKKK